MHNSQHISDQIEERMLVFSVQVIKLTKNLPKTAENEIIGRQLIRAASSIGANYTEANNAASRTDFRNKVFIAKKEASECRYWLRMLSAANNGVDLAPLLGECSEFIFILQKIISSLKAGKLRA